MLKEYRKTKVLLALSGICFVGSSPRKILGIEVSLKGGIFCMNNIAYDNIGLGVEGSFRGRAENVFFISVGARDIANSKTGNSLDFMKPKKILLDP